MEFGPVSPDEAEGAILAHSLMLSSGKRIRKGTMLDAETLHLIHEDGVTEVTVARLGASDVAEDEAATQIGKAIAGSNLRRDEARTGRVNFFATANGLFRVSKSLIDAVNAIDPAITLATLDDCAEVNDGRIVATIKIIPYAVSKKALDAVLALDLADVFDVHPYQAKRVVLISTELPGTKPATLHKTRANLVRRLAASGSSIVAERQVPHTLEEVSKALDALADQGEIIILFGASAISDARDVIPASIEAAGGEILRFGMPVDPGNLLLLAELDGTPVLGAPGCARSPAENGFDWVLQRLCADLPVTASDIAAMGVGGLLMETGSRPHPRVAREPGQAPVAAIILAAGQSRRMGEANKMTVSVKGKPMVRHVADAALASGIGELLVVTGHRPEETGAALEGIAFREIENPRYEEGLSSSLAAGILHLPEEAGGALILLGDMPFVEAAMIDRMIAAFHDNPGHIIMATHDGKRGNPVLWPARFFDELQHIEGDVGARHIIGANADFVVEVELGPAASLDLDTPEAVRAVEG